MNDSQSIVSSAPYLSTLPPELLDEILTQKSLSKSDLARCCLVSRHPLDSARPSLYSSIEYEYRFSHERDPLSRTVSYWLTSSSSKLLETLQSSSILKEMVTSLRLEVLWNTGNVRGYPSLDEPVIELLELFKNVTRLRLGASKFDGVLEYVHINGARWKELDVWDLESGLNLASDNIFPNLKKLSCFKLYSSDSTGSISLPPQLTTLEVQKLGFSPLTVANAHDSPLQSLLLRRDMLLNFPDVSNLPQLQHLYLRNSDIRVDPQQFANIVNTCQSLTSLSLNFSQWTPQDHFIDLLRGISLPRLLLSFPVYVPYDPLMSLLNSGHLEGIRTLAFSPNSFIRRFSKEKLKVLSRVCASRGVSVVYSDREWRSVAI